VLGSITPLGERSRGRRWGITVAAYTLGSIAGSLVLGLAAGSVGSVVLSGTPPALRVTTLAVFVLAGLAFELQAFGLRLPTHRRQVDEEWLTRYRGWVYGLGFGFQLGLALVTVVNTSAIYLMVVAAFLTASPTAGGFVLAVFGTARALVLLRAHSVKAPRDLRVLHDAIDRFQPHAKRLTVAVEGATALALIGLIPFAN
jgi:hypothetical protein